MNEIDKLIKKIDRSMKEIKCIGIITIIFMIIILFLI